MKIYMIRHGETDWNTKRLLQGATDIPLNENGRALARETSKKLEDVSFDVIFSSPLSRAYETAEIMRGNRNIPIITDDRIKEICFGVFEGFCCGKEGYNIPDPNFPLFFSDPEKFVAGEGGETIIQLCERTTDFLKEIAGREEYQDKTVLVSTHGAAMRGLLSSLQITDLKDFWHGGVHKNCAVTILDVQNGEITILEENKVYYDPEKAVDYYKP